LPKGVSLKPKERGNCYFCGRRTRVFCFGCGAWICLSCATKELDKYGVDGVPSGFHVPEDHRISKAKEA